INKDNGIEMIEINVVLKLRRNSKMMTTANKIPNNALLSIVSTDFSIGSPWSNVEEIVKPYSSSASATMSLTALTTSTVLASGDLMIEIPIDSSPFVREIDSASLTTSMSANSLKATVGIVVGAAGA